MKTLYSVVALLLAGIVSAFSQSTFTPLTAELLSTSATIHRQGSPTNGFFALNMSITAGDADIYLVADATLSTSTGGTTTSNWSLYSGFNWSLVTSNEQPVMTVATVDSQGALVTPNYLEILAGQTAYVFLNVRISPEQVPDFYGICLDSINWSLSPSLTDQNFLSVQNFQTGTILLQPAIVPEPSTRSLFGSGIGVAGLVFLLCRKPNNTR